MELGLSGLGHGLFPYRATPQSSDCHIEIPITHCFISFFPPLPPTPCTLERLYHNVNQGFLSLATCESVSLNLDTVDI